MVNEIIVAFLGPLLLTETDAVETDHPHGENSPTSIPEPPVVRSAFPGRSVSHALGTPAGIPLDLAVRIPFGHGLALVVLLLATRETELDLHPAVSEVHRQRHQRQPALT